MDQARDVTGDRAAALANGFRLLAQAPDLAAEQADEILRAFPGDPETSLLRGLALARLGRPREAIPVLRRAAGAGAGGPAAWQALSEQLALVGDDRGVEAATAGQIRASVSEPALVEAATALFDNRLAVAEAGLRAYLRDHPTNVAAIRMLAEVGARLGRYEDAELLLSRCLELAPGFAEARYNHATVLYRLGRPDEAIAQLEPLLARAPRHPGYRNLKAAALGRIGEYEQTIALYRDVLADHPDQPKAWMSLGHALKTVGRASESVEAYRRSLALEPSLGEAWWSLANLKTWSFAPADLEAMTVQAARSDLSDEDRFHLSFALGKALEDAGRYGESWVRYAEGAKLRRAGIDYDAEAVTAHMERSKAVFTPAFFAERADWGCDAADPIFVVGLPRSGSTLIEQILASHSAVEGTMELPDVISMARRLGGRRRRADPSRYPEMLSELDAEAVRALGEEYLDRTRMQRKLGRPFFIDKMPNNFAHIGLIRLILPRAKIIDARRHPMGCCFSAFKQHFARGQGFSYDLVELGRYYADYVALMAHFDAVQPGAVQRVFYERMVEDPEGEVRRLLDYCGLPFEDGCLRFYENDRAVRTASSEQVRRPIFADAVEHWRHYESHLGPLAEALGQTLARYPQAPSD
ncbi:tetratricopeptide repeat-containing sulfotransferase family protein [Caulobacter mirabilis]|uniref:Uncharacterized protein n=1 Tax=Caulobacter mirabilis TaxID=69666 RepID=A0A2D2B1N4_9CAUL|nr:sulfotransferase [Caulobacter mirabilis]ATQ44161.1 hypothetical protein CSW64_18095 [Caulobacter mirabilis]